MGPWEPMQIWGGVYFLGSRGPSAQIRISRKGRTPKSSLLLEAPVTKATVARAPAKGQAWADAFSHL